MAKWKDCDTGHQKLAASYVVLSLSFPIHVSSLAAQTVKSLPAMQETWVGSSGQEDSLKSGNLLWYSCLGEWQPALYSCLGEWQPALVFLPGRVATCSGILAWEVPWAEEPAGSGSMGSQTVGHD